VVIGGHRWWSVVIGGSGVGVVGGGCVGGGGVGGGGTYCFRQIKTW